nr:MAG TPA: hypothetical protein [Caudoviricetes sp.]
MYGILRNFFMNSKNSVPYGNTASSSSFRPAVLTSQRLRVSPGNNKFLA